MAVGAGVQLRGASPSVDVRAAGHFIALDLLTYVLVSWIVLPGLLPAVSGVSESALVAVGWLISAVRISLVGVVVARSVAGQLAAPAPGLSGGWSGLALVDLAIGVGFALVSLVFVAAGEPQRRPAALRSAWNDTGAANLLIIPAVAGILGAAILVIVMVGSATTDRRQATTAADAAALAAVDVWRDNIQHDYLVAAAAHDENDFWDFAGRRLSSFAGPSLTAAAQALADDNDADVVAMSVDPSTGEVTVRVRSRTVVPHTSTLMASVSTARLEFLGGACRSGVRVGFWVSGVCRTSAPPTPTPTPTPTSPPPPTPTPTPTPFHPPAGLSHFRLEVVLVPS